MSPSDSDFVLIPVGHLSKRERKLLNAYSRRVHQIVREGGRPISPLFDGLPILAGLSVELFPKLSSEQRIEMCGNVFETTCRAALLAQQQVVGSA